MLILASASPRRRELLELITPDFRVITSEVDESVSPSLRPQKAVEELALRKARAVFRKYPRDVVVGADTVVVLHERMLGKPATAEEAREMLRGLSGTSHSVYTGVAVVTPEGNHTFAEQTVVHMIQMSEADIDAYIATGEPFDKAGAYGIQGGGALFIRGIQGDFYNVMGLPVCRLGQILAKLL